jgi:hypothetical protein
VCGLASSASHACCRGSECSDCAGRGRAGACGVVVEGKQRTACQTRRDVWTYGAAEWPQQGVIRGAGMLGGVSL